VEDGRAPVKSRLKMVAVMTSLMKTARGWEDANCPLGEGMVDWKYVLGELCHSGFQGPISLHMEYEAPGATRTSAREHPRRHGPRPRLPESPLQEGVDLNLGISPADLN
jgi:sugar phosphate isomerase/epimerase